MSRGFPASYTRPATARVASPSISSRGRSSFVGDVLFGYNVLRGAASARSRLFATRTRLDADSRYRPMFSRASGFRTWPHGTWPHDLRRAFATAVLAAAPVHEAGLASLISVAFADSPRLECRSPVRGGPWSRHRARPGRLRCRVLPGNDHQCRDRGGRWRDRVSHHRYGQPTRRPCATPVPATLAIPRRKPDERRSALSGLA